MTIELQFEQRNIQSIISYNRKVEAVLNRASEDLAMKIAIFEMKYPTAISQGSFYKINKGLANKIDTILKKLHNDISVSISNGVVSQWDMANLKNNKLVGEWAKGIKLSKDGIPTSFNQLNLAAMDTFLTRTAAGMDISQRVWNLVNGAKDQVELYLASGISTGKSAGGIARDIKQYLNEPDRLFRRVRQEGKLVLSKAARGYSPGSGIYRSSYKNALRLAKNEINMSYRMSDYMRRKELPFITGIEVHLSASHPRLDMCDDLVGKYPKGFIFIGWHVGCLCYTTSIMLNKKDSLNFMKTGKIAKSSYISRIPTKASNWIKLNAKTIAGYKNTPYFIKDNFTTGFKLKDSVTKIVMPKFEAVKPGIPLFMPAKSIKEAERYMNIRNIRLGNPKDFPFTEVNISGGQKIRNIKAINADLNTLNQINSQFYQLRNTLKTEILNNISKSNTVVYILDTGKNGVPGISIRLRNMNIIGIDPKKSIKRSLVDKYVSITKEGIARHEWGHILEYSITQQEAQKIGIYGMKYYSSEYAKINFREKWAEFICEITKPEFNILTLPKDIQEIARRLLK